MINKISILLIFFLFSCLFGCAVLQSKYEPPSVNVTSFRLLSSNDLIPRFEIGLRITNPNSAALRLQGLSYHIEIEGHKIVSGVSKDLPHIEGYSEGNVTLTASANLLSGIRLITDLINQKRNTFTYGFEAKLDTGEWKLPIHIKEYGEFSLNQ